MFRSVIFCASIMLASAAASAEGLPWQQPATTPTVESAPPAKFFPINPRTLMHPPLRTYGIVSARTGVIAQKPRATNGTTSITEEQAQKLLAIYAN
jgi:hypothetical protein